MIGEVDNLGQGPLPWAVLPRAFDRVFDGLEKRIRSHCPRNAERLIDDVEKTTSELERTRPQEKSAMLKAFKPLQRELGGQISHIEGMLA